MLNKMIMETMEGMHKTHTLPHSSKSKHKLNLMTITQVIIMELQELQAEVVKQVKDSISQLQISLISIMWVVNLEPMEGLKRGLTFPE
jgi:hypothetical protein